ncbi:MAG: Uroporphyrinogen-III synthase [Betaproteobacteria bacterium ADurb.Bin341]|nr:MAG: Uroporphyrinogen-III synthase [Betaproteobacteria bacterium ADurb.Bin341]
MNRSPLMGKVVAITRAQAQNDGLARLIARAGGEALLLPLFKIVPVASEDAVLRACEHLGDYALAIFVSPNAVAFALPHVRYGIRWPPHLTLAAPGPGTAAALAEHGVGPVLVPQGRHDTEALLALPELQAPAVYGRRAVIFCGEGGRALLAETLAARGASVDVVFCYRRLPLPGTAQRLLQYWRQGRLDALVVTSSTALRYLHSAPQAEMAAVLAEIPLFVSHARIAELAGCLGLHHIIRTAADNTGIAASLCAYNWP